MEQSLSRLQNPNDRPLTEWPIPRPPNWWIDYVNTPQTQAELEAIRRRRFVENRPIGDPDAGAAEACRATLGLRRRRPKDSRPHSDSYS